MSDNTDKIQELLEQKRALTKSINSSPEWLHRTECRKELVSSAPWLDFEAAQAAVKVMPEYTDRAELISQIRHLKSGLVADDEE